jgi:hypothetical protein
MLLSAVLATLGGVQAQSSFDVQEANMMLQVATKKIQILESQLAASKDKNDALTQSAAAANQEAVEFKDRYERLRGLLEGLGISALENSTEQTQERLLASLSDLRIAENSRRSLAEGLMELAEVSLQFAKSAQSPEPALSDRLSKALTKAEEALHSAAASPQTEMVTSEPANLQDARVVSLKPDLGIAVLSVGSRDGVKPGMPFEIYREDKPIAKILVTEVRSSVSGAVVQELANTADPVKVGDRGKVDINRSF